MNQTPLNDSPLMHFDRSVGDVTHNPGLWLHFKTLGYRNRTDNNPVQYQMRHRDRTFDTRLIADYQR